jgi:hypothetical protein
MIINLWSTPRTGSTWYTAYLSKNYKSSIVLHQFLNEFNLSSYSLPNYKDNIYEYQHLACYRDFYYDNFSKKILYRIMCQARLRNIKEEEEYRIDLLEKHDSERYPLILHNHVKPMTEYAYKFLYNKASKNIFLHRKNFKDQLSSYALSYAIKNFHKRNYTIYENLEVDFEVLENLADRIIYWYKLPKYEDTIICYEELEFEKTEKNMPEKQNFVSTFNQLSEKTQNYILYLNNKIKSQIT